MAGEISSYTISLAVAPEAKSALKQLKDDIKEATSEVIRLRSQDILDEDAIVAATKRAGQLKDEFTAANEAIKTMTAGDEFEKLGNSVGLLSSQVSSLDFGGAAESAAQLTGTLKGLNPAKMKEDFKTFTSAVGALSKQFISMGVSLLLNPIFLITAVVVAIVVAIVLLKDKLIIVEKVFDLMMVPIRALIQGLKDLTDWLGLTTYASDEMSEKIIANNDRLIASEQRNNDILGGVYKRRLALMKANGEDTTAFEIDNAKQEAFRLQEKKNRLKVSYEETQKLLENASKDEREELTKQRDEKKKLLDDTINIYADAANNIEVLTASSNKKQRDEAKKNDEKSTADRLKANAASKAARAKADADALEALKRRYDVERAIIQSNIYIMEDGLAKDLAINAEKQRILEQDLENSKYNEEEKRKLRLVYQSIREADDIKAFKESTKRYKEKDEEEKRDLITLQNELKALNDSYNDYILSAIGTDGQKRNDAIQKEQLKQEDNEKVRYNKLLQDQKLNDSQKEQLLREHLARMKSIKEAGEVMQNESDATTRKEEIDAIVEKYNEIADIVSGFNSQLSEIVSAGLQNRIDANEEEKTRAIDNLTDQQNQELSVVGLTESQKSAINDKYAKEKYKIELKAFNEGEKLKKKQFDNDKAFRMAGVVMDTATGIMKVVGTYADKPWAMVPLIAATAAIGIAQLAVISKQKYKGSTGPSAPSSSSAGGSGMSEPTNPDLKLTGKQSDDNSKSSTDNKVMDQTIIVKAYVSETEITDTQEKIAKIKQSGEL